MSERCPSQPYGSESLTEEERAALEFVRLLHEAKSAVVLTGAGVSTDSGIPDFRSPDGLYSRVPSYIFDLDFFFETPDRFYALAKDHLYPMLDALPNVTHTMLAELERRGYLRAVITQNIDGLHQKAGSKTVIELHGNLGLAVCVKCGTRYNASHVLKLLETSPIPLCNKCRGLIKPDIVFFKEALPEKAMERSIQLSQEADIFVAMGTSLVVYPAASLPTVAKSAGKSVIVLNREPTPYDTLADRAWNVELSRFSKSVLKLLEGMT